MQQNARALADNLTRRAGASRSSATTWSSFPLVAFRLKGEHASYDESDIAWQLSAERGWMVPAYTLPPNAEDVKILRALVKETMSREQVDRLTQDIEDACRTLDEKGGAHPKRARAGEARHGLLTLGPFDDRKPEAWRSLNKVSNSVSDGGIGGAWLSVPAG